MHKGRGNYSSCTCGSSENIGSRSGGAQEKGKRGETQFGTKNGAFLSFTPLLKAIVLVCRFFLNLTPGFEPNSGLWCCVFLALRNTLMFVGVWTPHHLCSRSQTLLERYQPVFNKAHPYSIPPYPL